APDPGRPAAAGPSSAPKVPTLPKILNDLTSRLPGGDDDRVHGLLDPRLLDFLLKP
ncbi:MAG: hypothetical protein JWR63_2132, partial [Conexibacter sp.]|nr:hypothetical protein [Conexibacter sp.]